MSLYLNLYLYLNICRFVFVLKLKLIIVRLSLQDETGLVACLSTTATDSCIYICILFLFLFVFRFFFVCRFKCVFVSRFEFAFVTVRLSHQDETGRVACLSTTATDSCILFVFVIISKFVFVFVFKYRSVFVLKFKLIIVRLSLPKMSLDMWHVCPQLQLIPVLKVLCEPFVLIPAALKIHSLTSRTVDTSSKQDPCPKVLFILIWFLYQ